MKTLTDCFNKFCKIKYKNYKKISEHITLVDDFFEDFEAARDFFVNREKWDCSPYSDISKPGYESLLPSWISSCLMKKYFTDNNIDSNSEYSASVNFFFDTFSKVRNVFASGYYPHVDGAHRNISLKICLVNLNKIKTSTNFYSYNNYEYCTPEIFKYFQAHSESISYQCGGYYGKPPNSITREEYKNFLHLRNDSMIKLVNNVEYEPNQAIIYSGSLFHTMNLTKEFSENNPRCMLTMSFNNVPQ